MDIFLFSSYALEIPRRSIWSSMLFSFLHRTIWYCKLRFSHLHSAHFFHEIQENSMIICFVHNHGLHLLDLNTTFFFPGSHRQITWESPFILSPQKIPWTCKREQLIQLPSGFPWLNLQIHHIRSFFAARQIRPLHFGFQINVSFKLNSTASEFPDMLM